MFAVIKLLHKCLRMNIFHPCGKEGSGGGGGGGGGVGPEVEGEGTA